MDFVSMFIADICEAASEIGNKKWRNWIKDFLLFLLECVCVSLFSVQLDNWRDVESERERE